MCQLTKTPASCFHFHLPFSFCGTVVYQSVFYSLHVFLTSCTANIQDKRKRKSWLWLIKELVLGLDDNSGACYTPIHHTHLLHHYFPPRYIPVLPLIHHKLLSLNLHVMLTICHYISSFSLYF